MQNVKVLRALTIYGFVLVALTVLAIIIPRGQEVVSINAWNSPLSDTCFKLITVVGDGAVLIVVLVASLFIRFGYAILVGAAAILHGLMVSICKILLFPGLPRPAKVLDPEKLHFVAGVKVHSMNTFPSGHTATGFCLAMLLLLLTRKSWIAFVMLTVALLIGYSRIYLLQHFLIDVAAGAWIGVLSTWMLWYGYERLAKPAWMNNRLEISLKQSEITNTMQS